MTVFGRWWKRTHATDPMVAHLLWLHAAKLDRERERRR